MKKLYFEEIALNQTHKSIGRTITETDIVQFAGLSGDYNPLHMDAEFAKNNMFKQRIAHGLLGLAIASGIQTDEPAYHIEAFVELDWKFKRPIFIGDTVHLETTPFEKKDARNPGSGLIIVKRKLLNQNGKVTQEGTFRLLVKKESSATDK